MILHKIPFDMAQLDSSLKVSKFQNEFIKSSFLPKYEPNIVMISALHCIVPHYRAEILTIFGSYFGRNDDFINSFWNFLTFASLLCEVELQSGCSWIKPNIYRFNRWRWQHLSEKFRMLFSKANSNYCNAKNREIWPQGLDLGGSTASNWRFSITIVIICPKMIKESDF